MPNEKKQGTQDEQAQGEQASRAIPKLSPMPARIGDPAERDIGKRIAFARKQLGLSIEALARYAVNFDKHDKKGISATSLLRYESGEYDPGAREIRILCDAFCASPRWLIYGELDNTGEDAAEQNLLQALEVYVLNRSKELRFEDGEPLSKSFDNKPSVEQRLDWLTKAKKRPPGR
jgi:transcriptional regulator with XRE-family HTH domain